MTITETLAIIVSALSLAIVVLSMLKNYFGNEDFRSAFKNYLDPSTKLTARAKACGKIIEIVLVDTMPLGKYHRKVILLMNSALITSVSALYRESDDSSEEKKRSNTIAGVMLLERLKKSTKLQIILILCIVLNLLVSFLPTIDFSYFLLAVASLLLLCIHADQQLIEYRIKKGWYGKNEYETKEIINFIISHSNKNDFNDSGGLKRVIPLPEVDSEPEKVSEFGGATT
jgi:amino acid permease